MPKFRITFQRTFEVDIDVATLDIAQGVAQQTVAQHPPGTCKLMSVVREDLIEKEDPPKPPFGRPLGGGSPGTPVIRQDVLVDQIAKVA